VEENQIASGNSQNKSLDNLSQTPVLYHLAILHDHFDVKIVFKSYYLYNIFLAHQLKVLSHITYVEIQSL